MTSTAGSDCEGPCAPRLAPAPPAITMAHGFAGVKEHRLEAYATAFADRGFIVLVHDHRNFGASDGTPRNDIDPWQQVADWRRAISFLESQDCVNSQKIGLWGSSFAGGHHVRQERSSNLSSRFSSDLPLSALMASSSIGLWFIALTSVRRWEGSPRAGADRPSAARPAPVRAAVSTNTLRDKGIRTIEG